MREVGEAGPQRGYELGQNDTCMQFFEEENSLNLIFFFFIKYILSALFVRGYAAYHKESLHQI